MTECTAQSEKKLGGIEILRFLCAVAVIVHHYRFYFVSGVWTPQSHAPIEAFPFYSALALFYWKGLAAVQLFWAISGFIFFWKYADAIHDRVVAKRHFFVFRFSRLYPLHFLTLVIVIGLQALYLRDHSENFIYRANDMRAFLLQLVMASNWNATCENTYNGPIWSVSAEVLIYGLFFLTVRLFRPSAVLCFMMVMAAFVVISSPLRTPLLNLSICVIYFFGGGLTYLGVKHVAAAYRRLTFWCAAASSVVIAMAMFPHGFSDFDVPPYLMMLLSSSLVVSFALLEDVFPINLTRLARLGDLTYGSYLWHFPLQLAAVVVIDRIGWSREIFLSPLPLVIWVGLTFVLAAASHRFFEMPAQNTIRRAFSPRIFSKAPSLAQP